MWRLGSRLSRQGSSLPDGARMLAVSRLRSVSVIFSETSVEVPTLSWDVRMESSPMEMPSVGPRGQQPQVGGGWMGSPGLEMDGVPMAMWTGSPGTGKDEVPIDV